MMRLPLAFLALSVILVATGADHSWDGKVWQCELSTNAEQEACTGPDHADMAKVVRACGKKNAHGWKHGSWSCSGSCAHPEHLWDDCLGESENCPIYDASDGLLPCCKAGFSHNSDTSYDCSTLAVTCTAFARHCVSDDVDIDGTEEFQFEIGIPDTFTNAEVTEDMSALMSNIAVQYTQWQLDRSSASRRLEYQFGDALGTEHKGEEDDNDGDDEEDDEEDDDAGSGGSSTATNQTCVFTDKHTDFSAPAGMEGLSEDLAPHMNAELVDEFGSGSVQQVGSVNKLDDDECGFFIQNGTLNTSSVGLQVYFTKDLPAVDVDGTSCSFPNGNSKAIITQFYQASDITATRNTSVPLVKGLVAANAGRMGLTDACLPFVDRVLGALRRGISKKRFEFAATLATTTRV